MYDRAMVSKKPKSKTKAGNLPSECHEAFRADCAVLSDVELAVKYELRERTATNWRLRLYGQRLKSTDQAA